MEEDKAAAADAVLSSLVYGDVTVPQGMSMGIEVVQVIAVQ